MKTPGSNFVGKAYVTNHAIDGYLDRVGGGTRSDIRRRIASAVATASRYEEIGPNEWRAICDQNMGQPPFVVVLKYDGLRGTLPAAVSCYALGSREGWRPTLRTRKTFPFD